MEMVGIGTEEGRVLEKEEIKEMGKAFRKTLYARESKRLWGELMESAC